MFFISSPSRRPSGASLLHWPNSISGLSHDAVLLVYLLDMGQEFDEYTAQVPNPHPWRADRPGSPSYFWHALRDVLRHLSGARRRGSYWAPGPNGRRNNIVRTPLPGRLNSPRHYPTGPPHDSTDHGVDRLPGRPVSLGLPAPSGPPVAVTPIPLPPLPHYPLPPHHPKVAVHRPHPVFRGEKITGGEPPLSFRQEILFKPDSDEFVNVAAAGAAVRDLVELLLAHRELRVTILGNAASVHERGAPYGSDRAALWRWRNMSKFGTTGKLMLAQAQAIARLLLSRGVSLTRVTAEVGRFEEVATELEGRDKRRATIIISRRP